MLTTESLKGNWKQIKGKIKEKWGKLTDDDLKSFSGEADQLVGLIQRKTGESRESIENFVEDAMAEGGSLTSRVAGAAAGAYETAKDSVGKAYDKVSETVREGYETTEHLVQEHPGKSMAVAFGVGMISGVVVGLILGSK